MLTKKAPSNKSASPKASPSQASLFPSNDTNESGTTTATAQNNATSTETSLTKRPSTSLTTVPKTTAPVRSGKTRVIVKYDVGFSNFLTIRGKGANLSWEKGILLKNNKNDEWVWETEIPFTQCEFKVLINDISFETGDNHPLQCGASIQYTPQFS